MLSIYVQSWRENVNNQQTRGWSDFGANKCVIKVLYVRLFEKLCTSAEREGLNVPAATEQNIWGWCFGSDTWTKRVTQTETHNFRLRMTSFSRVLQHVTWWVLHPDDRRLFTQLSKLSVQIRGCFLSSRCILCNYCLINSAEINL